MDLQNSQNALEPEGSAAAVCHDRKEKVCCHQEHDVTETRPVAGVDQSGADEAEARTNSSELPDLLLNHCLQAENEAEHT